jgi:hypothetical protein
MNRILVAFDYWGPNYPLRNNQNFNRPLTELMVDDTSCEFFNKISKYKCVPSSFIKDDDLFIYPIIIGFNQFEWPYNTDIDILSSTSMSINVFNSIRSRNGFLFLDLGNESAMTDSLLDKIHSYMLSKDIPLRKVIFQTGNINGIEIYKNYCFKKGIIFEKAMNISCIEYFEWHTSKHYHVGINNQGFIPLPKNVDYSKIEKTFLCLNNKQRQHRKNLFILWNLNDLIKDSFYTMPNKSGYKLDTKTYNLNDYIDTKLMHRVGATPEYIAEIGKTLPLVIDDPTRPVNLTSLFASIVTYYQSSLISVVTETNFEGSEVSDIFNTEKIFKPMIHRHPFILVGPYKTLEHLKNMGYKTFSEFWDESYDDIEDPTERLLKIVELCKSINEWSDLEKKMFFYKSMIVTNHNHKLLTECYPNNMRKNFWHEFENINHE